MKAGEKRTYSGRRLWLVAIVLCVVPSGGVVAQQAPPGKAERRPPNILIIVSDDQAANFIGYRAPTVRTPALDQLAKHRMRCDRGYAASPLCAPTRYALQTGRHAA